MASAIAYLKNVVGDDGVGLRADVSAEPSPISRTDCEGWKKVVSAVQGTWRGAVVSPYLMVQCSDSRHYRDLSDRVFRFSAMESLLSSQRFDGKIVSHRGSIVNFRRKIYKFRLLSAVFFAMMISSKRSKPD